ncbi:MAG: peptidoglycan DD-metalloendopeptidase family protein [Candidatus Omnitrophica bacterium]|nr:peptidoglycan DD-metalloendopeptidase family protein [Candidatus Omnitrophota bacterium]
MSVKHHWLIGCALGWLLCGCAGTGSYVGRQAMPAMPGTYHRVIRGETLWRIAQRYQVEVDDLVSVNRLPNAAQLNAGQLIFVPQLPASREEAASFEAPQRPAALPPTGGPSGDFVWPVRGKVVAPFGARLYGATNRGIDIRGNPSGTVVASRAGRVVFLDARLHGYGRTIILDHGDGLMTVYAGVAESLVALGETVAYRAPIARLGDGAAAVLHFEIRRNARPQNPHYYLSLAR